MISHEVASPKPYSLINDTVVPTIHSGQTAQMHDVARPIGLAIVIRSRSVHGNDTLSRRSYVGCEYWLWPLEALALCALARCSLEMTLRLNRGDNKA